MEYEQGLSVEDQEELQREKYKWTRMLIKMEEKKRKMKCKN
jgi:hypothetical protein